MIVEKLTEILDKHKKWLRNEDGGSRANLSGAYLYGANLSGANLNVPNLYHYCPNCGAKMEVSEDD